MRKRITTFLVLIMVVLPGIAVERAFRFIYDESGNVIYRLKFQIRPNISPKNDVLEELEATASPNPTDGNYSFGPSGYRADWRDHIFVHEYGHYLQSLRWGVGFLLVPGPYSLISAWIGGNHLKSWTETDASKLGMDYFDKHY